MAPECSVLPAKKDKNALDTSLCERWLFFLALQHLIEMFELDSCHVQKPRCCEQVTLSGNFGTLQFSLHIDLMTS